jgi:hypothetical protein
MTIKCAASWENRSSSKEATHHCVKEDAHILHRCQCGAYKRNPGGISVPPEPVPVIKQLPDDLTERIKRELDLFWCSALGWTNEDVLQFCVDMVRKVATGRNDD